MTTAGERDTPGELVRSRPETESSYGIPDDDTGMLEWQFVEETMTNSEQYWLVTVRPDGHPHARPTWGVWESGALHCGGGRGTRWVRNVANDNRVTAHTESATTVVIIEGTTNRIDSDSASPERIQSIDSAYEEKYGMPHGPPLFEVVPERVLAWSEFPTDATRWVSSVRGETR